MEPGPLFATAQERPIRHGSFSGYHPVAAGAKKKLGAHKLNHTVKATAYD